MRVIQNNQQKLQLKIVPWRVWLASIGMVLLGIALLPPSASGRLQCERGGNNAESNDVNQCQFSYRHLLVPGVDFDSRSIPIQEIQRAEVESYERRRERRGRRRKETRYQLVLQTRYETIEMSVSGRRQRSVQQNLAQDINQFLNNSEESQLVVQTPQAWASLAIPLGLILMAPLIAIEFRKTISCTFDKTSDRLTILRKGVADEQTLDYPLQAITEVTVESRDTGDDHEEHRLVVQIDDEKTVPITEYGHMLGFSHQEAIAQRIEAFLGLSD